MLSTSLPRKARLSRWHDASSPAGAPRHACASVVESMRLHLNEAHASVLEQLETCCSIAVGKALAWVQNRLDVRLGEDPAGATQRPRLLAADLRLDPELIEELPPWIHALLKEAPESEVVPAVPKDPDAIRIAWGKIVRSPAEEGENKGKKSWRVKHRDPRMELQQLFLNVLPPSFLEPVPAPLRAGVTQEVAQQLISHLLLQDSGEVAAAVFPTTEERDPVARRARWEDALERVCQSSKPFAYTRARDLDPGAYAADDPRGDRLVNVDPDWHIVTAPPAPRRTPLLFVLGASVRLYRRLWRPDTDPSILRTGTVAAIPIGKDFFESLPQDMQTAVRWWKKPGVCETFSPLLPRQQKKESLAKVRTPLLVIPVSYGKKRTEQYVFSALTRLPIRWVRLVHRSFRRGPRQNREKWFLQLTIGYHAPTEVPTRIIGIHFSRNDLYHWALIEDRGPGNDPVLVDEGCRSGNPILAHGLAKKEGLEWDQQKGCWAGGKVYARTLRQDTSLVVDHLLILAHACGVDGVPAGIGAERLRWVPKRSGTSAQNRMNSAWNYGQLVTILRYKAPPAGVRFISEIYPTKTDKQQDDAEQARRIARKTLKRLHEQLKRAAEAAAKRAQEAQDVLAPGST